MAFFQTIFVALLAIPTVFAAPHEMHLIRSGPQAYSGPASSFPAMSTWADFNATVSHLFQPLPPSLEAFPSTVLIYKPSPPPPK